MTLVEKLAQHFRSNPNTWIDGLALAGIAGSYAWRSRCSDLRKPPFGMVIENRQRRIQRPTVHEGRACIGVSYVVSEYRYVPGVTGDRPADDRGSHGHHGPIKPELRANAGERPAPAVSEVA